MVERLEDNTKGVVKRSEAIVEQTEKQQQQV